MPSVSLSPVKWFFSRAEVFKFPRRVFPRGEGFSPGEEVFPRRLYVVADVVVDDAKLD